MTDRRAPAEVRTRPAVDDDVDWIAELRAIVLRSDLTRLGRYDDVRVRQRFRDAFAPEETRVIIVDGEEVGSVALRDEGGSRWLEHFYIVPSHQGAGVGGRILTMLLDDDVPIVSTCSRAVLPGRCMNATASSSRGRTRSTSSCCVSGRARTAWRRTAARLYR